MSKSNRLRSKEVHKIGNSPEPNIHFDWSNMRKKEIPKKIHLSSTPSRSALITLLLFIILIGILIYL